MDDDVLVGAPGDMSGAVLNVPDGVTNMGDISAICSAFGATPGNPRWDPKCDVTGPTSRVTDGAINMRDIANTCTHFGET